MNYLFATIIGVCVGWVWAHRTIAEESERLGSFYVNEKTYYIKEILTKEEATKRNVYEQRKENEKH